MFHHHLHNHRCFRSSLIVLYICMGILFLLLAAYAFHPTRTTSIIINWKSDEQEWMRKLVRWCGTWFQCEKQNKTKKSNLETKIESISKENIDKQLRIGWWWLNWMKDWKKKKKNDNKIKIGEKTSICPKDSSSKWLWMIKLWKAFLLLLLIFI